MSIKRSWCKWMESVRKDVECTFGMLKGRWRILKVPMPFHTKREVDNVFFTCCALDNMLLEHDGKLDQWVTTIVDHEENMTVGAAEISLYDAEDVGKRATKKFNQHMRDVFIEQRDMDCSDIGVEATAPGEEGVVKSPPGLARATEAEKWAKLRMQLDAHFKLAKEGGLVEWLRGRINSNRKKHAFEIDTLSY